MKYTLLCLVVLSCLTIHTSIAVADDTTMTPTEHAKHHPGKKGMMEAEPSGEMRKKMAMMHQKMADCLNGTKSVKDCKKEMMDDCPMMKGKEKCSMKDDMPGM
jgi:hypothetical protein